MNFSKLSLNIALIVNLLTLIFTLAVYSAHVVTHTRENIRFVRDVNDDDLSTSTSTLSSTSSTSSRNSSTTRGRNMTMSTRHSSYNKLMICLRNQLGEAASNHTQVRCALLKMRHLYLQMKQINCKNCNAYFQCAANYNAYHNCQQTELVMNATIAITHCMTNNRNMTGEIHVSADEASQFGRDGGDCEQEYTCQVNCKFNPTTGTCSRRACG